MTIAVVQASGLLRGLARFLTQLIQPPLIGSRVRVQDHDLGLIEIRTNTLTVAEMTKVVMAELSPNLDLVVVDGDFRHPVSIHSRRALRKGAELFYTTKVQVWVTNSDRTRILQMVWLPVLGLQLKHVPNVVRDVLGVGVIHQLYSAGAPVAERAMETGVVEAGMEIEQPDP